MRGELTAIGELLIDFAPCGRDERGLPRFTASPGGAPANVCAMYARLGGTASFIGKIGNDAFGAQLRAALEQSAVGTKGLITDPEAPTSLAFVTLDERGDRDFCFYRRNSADTMLRAGEITAELIGCEGFFHFGSVSLTDEPARSATLFAAARARASGCTVSYDPNYRPPLWKSEAEAREWMLRGVSLCDILKVSDGELTFLTGKTDFEAGAEALLARGPKVVLVTCGADGAYFRTARVFGHEPGFRVEAIDTTGAGDTFLGTFLYGVRELTPERLAALTEPELRTLVRRCNAAAAITTTGLGAIPAMPDGAALERFLRERTV